MLVAGVVIFQLALIAYLLVYYQVVVSSGPRIFKAGERVPFKYTAIIIGTGVKPDGSISTVLWERLEKAVELRRTGCVRKFLLTVDHGAKAAEEIETMREFLASCNIPSEEIFSDSKGQNAYVSLLRAKIIYKVNDAVIVSQAAGLPREVYLAVEAGINAAGSEADHYRYDRKGYVLSERFRIIEAFLSANFGAKPVFTGDEIPITRKNRLSRAKRGQNE